MKKAYVKPQVYFENFQLSASIAKCDIRTNNTDINSCEVEGNTPGEPLFITIMSCKNTMDNEGYCYQELVDNFIIATS